MTTHCDRIRSHGRIESPTSRRWQVARRLRATFTVLPLFVAASACASTDSEGTPLAETESSAAAPLDSAVDAPLPTVAVTYSVLASVVRELVDGVAEVVTIIPDGVDPHDFEPSARDIETLDTAEFVVANGLHFEAGLDSALEQLGDSGQPIFYVIDHVTARLVDDSHGDEHSHGDDHTGDGHDHGPVDVHVWTSPATLVDMIEPLAVELGTALGVDLSTSAADLVASLNALDSEILDIMAAVPDCELITGHDELGYFADRYGCEVIDTLIPSSTTTAEASAKQLAEVKALVVERGAKVIFTSLGTPRNVAEQLARESGAQVVELPTHVMGGADSYAGFVRGLATTIAEALT